MKKIYYLLFFSIISLFYSCSEENWDHEELIKSEGTLILKSFEISIDQSINPTNEIEDSIFSPNDTINFSNYIINIVDQQTSEIIKSWTYNDMPDEVILKDGKYLIEVKSHNAEPAQWDTPYYYGVQDFSIIEDETTQVTQISCKLSNVIIYVNYNKDLYETLDNGSKVNVYISNESQLEYNIEETRGGYFTLPYSNSSIVAELNAIINNDTIIAHKIIPNVEEGQIHTITFSYEDLDNVDNPNAPTITSETLVIDGVNTITDSIIAKVDINAPYGIKNFIVDIISEQLTKDILQEVGLDSSFDLANPGELAGPLTELGFPTGSAVVGQTYLAFNITDFMQLLALFPGQHQFKLTIIDNKGYSIIETLTFIAQEQNNIQSAPTITSETLDINNANYITDNIIAKVDINAPNGIKNFVVDIISEQLTTDLLKEVGLDSTFDLANPGELAGPLGELGFPTGEDVVGKTYLAFDITDFMQLLVLFPGQHQFRLTITDKSDNTVSKTLTFIAQ